MREQLTFVAFIGAVAFLFVAIVHQVVTTHVAVVLQQLP